jgi:CBS domain containing-hemolysin-like protein
VSTGDWWTVIIIVVLVVLSAVFAGAETAFSKMTRVHAIHLEEQGKRFAKYAVSISADPARYINPVLLAMLATHVLGTALAAALAIKHLHEAGEWIATIVMTTVLFIFAEAVPKTSALQHTDAWVLPLSPFVYWLGVSVYPLTKVLIGIANVILPGKGLAKGPFMTEREIRHIVDVAEEEEVIEEQEREMIHSIFELGDTLVREVMVPRPDMTVVEANYTLQAAAELAIKHGFSRIPVYENEPDNIVGVLYTKDLFRPLRGQDERVHALKDLVRPAYFVPETMKVSDLMREMQKRHVHMAIVADEYGDVAGLVTLEDVLEEIVGEITDEYDIEESKVQPIGTDGWRVQAKTPIWELNEQVHASFPEDEAWDTVGGMVASALAKIPEPGDEINNLGFNFRVERVNGRRIGTVFVRRATREHGQVQSNER